MDKNTKSRCRYLRTRMSYAPVIGDFGDWRSNRCTSNVYWCLKTMTTAGPDQNFVAPETCQPSRTCHEE